MNILELKRSARGYSYREGSDDYNYPPPAAAATPDYSKPGWTYEGPQQGWVFNPAVAARAAATSSVAAPPIVATSGPSAGQTLAPVISTTGGGGPNVDTPITASLEAYESVNPDGTINRYDTQGNFVTTYTPDTSDIVGDFFAGIDSSLGLSSGLTSIGKALENFDNTLGLSRNAPAIVGLAASYFLPGIGQALGQSLVNAGVLTGAAATPAMATAIGTALAQTGVSVAQGKSLDEALTNAIISVGTAGLTQAFGADVKSAISQITDNPIAQKAIFKAGTDVVTAVAQGKSGDEVLQGIGRSVVSTVAGAAANEIVKNIPGINALPDAAKKVVTSGIATSIQGGDGTKSMLNTALREGTNYVLDAVTSTPGSSAANPMSQDPAQRADTVTGGAATLDDVESTLAANGLVNTGISGTTGAMQGGFGSDAVTPTPADVTPTPKNTGSTTTTDTINTLTNNGLQETTPDVITGIGTSDTSNVATGTETLASQTGTKLKTSDGEDVKLTDAQLDALVQKQLVFEGGDYNTKQDAANEAKLAGYTQFEYDGSVYTMQPNGPTERALFQTLIDEAPTQNSAFNVARKLLGTETTFSYNGKELTTVTADEQNAKMQEAAYNDPTRALDNFYSGNIRYAGYDVQGDVAGKTKLSAPAQSVLDQLIATGAKGIGDQLQTFAAGVSLSTGTSLDTAASRLGDFLVQYGKDKDGTDVAKQEETLKSDWANAGKLSFFDQPGAIATAIKENPLGFVSLIGQEFVQEGLPWIAGSVAGATALAFGAPVTAGLTTAAVVSSVLDGWESFGAGGKEAYELLKKAGVPDDVARDKAIANGALHAAVTIPAEFLADKMLFQHYFKGLTGGLKEYAGKYGSTIGVNAASEFIETIPQNLSTTYTVNGKITAKDMQSATAGAWAAASIGAGVATGAISPAAINEAVSIGKDYAGNEVSFGDFISGKKTVDLSTLKSDAALGADASGNQLTLGNALVDNDYLRIDPAFIDDFLPTAFVDPFVTDESEAREIARELGYTNPSQQVIDSLVGQTSEADTTKKLDAVANAQKMMSDLGLDLSDQDAISLANKITASSDTTGIDEFLNRFGATTEGLGTTPKPGDANDFLNQTGVTTGATGSTGTVLSTDPTNNTALVVNSSGATTVVDNTNNTLKVGDTVPTTPATTPTATPTTTPTTPNVVDDLVKSGLTETATPATTTPTTTPTATQTTSTPLTTEQKNKIISDAIAKTPSGSSSADIANAINTAALGTKLTDAENRLDAAIQSAKAIGLQGDAALQSGLNTVAADLGIAKTELLAQIGKSENDLRNEFQAGLGGVTTDIAKTRTDLNAAIAANESAGLTRDQATQKAINDVAAQLGTTKTDLLAQLGTTEAALSTQIAGVKTDLASQLNAQGNLFMDSLVQQGMNQQEALETAIAAQTKLVTEGQTATQTALGELSAAQQQEVANRVAAGQATDAAIAAVKATVETGQAATQTALGELSAAQQKEVADRVAAGQETNAAIADVKATVETGQAATQAALGELSAAQQKEVADRVAAGEETNVAIAAVQSAVETGQAALESKLTTQGKEFMDALVAQGMDQKTALETAMAAQTQQLTELSTGITTQFGEAEKQRQADITAAATQRQADLDAAAAAAGEAEKQRLATAAEVERQRQLAIADQKAREAANLKTIQTGQIRGQMMTGLQGLMGGLQQQATQMAAPAQVETVKATPGFSFDSPLNVGFFGGYESQKAPTKDKESLKIATGGYLDDLLEAIR